MWIYSFFLTWSKRIGWFTRQIDNRNRTMGSKLCYTPRNIWLSIFCVFETVCFAFLRKFVVIFERRKSWDVSKMSILVKSVAMLLMSAKKQSTFFLLPRYFVYRYSILTPNWTYTFVFTISSSLSSSAKSHSRVPGGNRTGDTFYLQQAWSANHLATSYPLLWIQNTVAISLRINNDAGSQLESLSVRRNTAALSVLLGETRVESNIPDHQKFW